MSGVKTRKHELNINEFTDVYGAGGGGIAYTINIKWSVNLSIFQKIKISRPRVTKIKLFFPALLLVFNSNSFEFSAAILKMGLSSFHIGKRQENLLVKRFSKVRSN